MTGKSLNDLKEKINNEIDQHKNEINKLSRVLAFLDEYTCLVDDLVNNNKRFNVKISYDKDGSFDVVRVYDVIGSIFMEKHGMVYLKGEVGSFHNGTFEFSNRSVGIDLDKLDNIKIETISDEDYKTTISTVIEKIIK